MNIEVKLSDDQVSLINEFLETTKNSEFSSRGPLDMQKLVEMLLEDVVLMVRRPGSWEGSNMHQVMTAHGYRF